MQKIKFSSVSGIRQNMVFIRGRVTHNIQIFLLSEHILYKESIVIVKKFDFEILTYLYVLRSIEFIYAIFRVMSACMFVCMFMWVNTIASKQCIRLSLNLVYLLQVIVRRILLILVYVTFIAFLQEYIKEFLHNTAYGGKFLKVC